MSDGSEMRAGNLNASELYRILDYLREHVNSEQAVIKLRTDAPDISGNIIHLSGPDFLSGLRDYLKSRFLDAEEILGELAQIMEISCYVRHGGIKAIIYRLETGRCNLVKDYFDSVAAELSYKYQDGNFVSPKEGTQSTLLERLKAIDAQDELIVSAAISEIDEILLELARKVEDISLEKLKNSSIESE